MVGRDARDWMMSEALSALAKAERMHRQFFTLSSTPAGPPCWEPPVDVYESDGAITVMIALPGVRPDDIEAGIDGRTLVVRGRRVLPDALRQAVVHRLELPQGRFERRIPLPAGEFRVRTTTADGCLVVTLEKAAGA